MAILVHTQHVHERYSHVHVLCFEVQTGPVTFHIVSIVPVLLSRFDCTVLYPVKDEAVHEVGVSRQTNMFSALNLQTVH